jgi:hypothetical protein
MSPAQHLTSDELLGYQDGTLPPQRQQAVVAHLATCPSCRAEMEERAEIARLLRYTLPPLDDPLARARLKARLRTHEPQEREPTDRQRRVAHGAALPVSIAALLLLVLVLGLLATETVVEGGHSFSRWLTQQTFTETTSPGAHPGGPFVFAPTEVVGDPTARLPHNLVEVIDSSDTAPVGRYFRNPDGLALLLEAQPAGNQQLTLPAARGKSQIMALEGHDVLVLFGPTRNHVAVVNWLAGDELYQLMVLEQPSMGIGLEVALEIAAAIMRQQATGAWS